MGSRDKGKKETKKQKKDGKKASPITSQPSLPPVKTVEKKRRESDSAS